MKCSVKSPGCFIVLHYKILYICVHVPFLWVLSCYIYANECISTIMRIWAINHTWHLLLIILRDSINHILDLIGKTYLAGQYHLMINYLAGQFYQINEKTTLWIFLYFLFSKMTLMWHIPLPWAAAQYFLRSLLLIITFKLYPIMSISSLTLYRDESDILFLWTRNNLRRI